MWLIRLVPALAAVGIAFHMHSSPTAHLAELNFLITFLPSFGSRSL